MCKCVLLCALGYTKKNKNTSLISYVLQILMLNEAFIVGSLNAAKQTELFPPSFIPYSGNLVVQTQIYTQINFLQCPFIAGTL